MLKKLLTVGIAAAALFSLVACANPSESTSGSSASSGNITGTWEGKLMDDHTELDTISITFNGEKANVTRTPKSGTASTYELFYTKVNATAAEFEELNKHSNGGTYQEVFLLSEKKPEQAINLSDLFANHQNYESLIGTKGFTGFKMKNNNAEGKIFLNISSTDNKTAFLYPKA